MLARRRGPGRDGGPHAESALHFYPDADVICDVGGQDIKLIVLQERPGQGLQAQHAVLGRQRLLPAVARPRRFGFTVEELRRHRLQRRVDAELRLRLRRVHAVGHRRLPAPGLDSPRRSWPAWPPCCRRTSGSTSPRSRTWRSWARTSCCRAARSTTWPRSSRRSTSSSRASRARAWRPSVIVHKHCGESGAIGAALEARAPLRTNGRRTALHRPATRCRQIEYRDHARRGHALLLLQEQVPAHVHRRRTGSPAPTRRRRCAARASSKMRIEGAAGRGEQRLIIATVREGHGRGRRVAMREIKKGSTRPRTPIPTSPRLARRGRVPQPRRRRQRRPTRRPSARLTAAQPAGADELVRQRRASRPHRHAPRAQHVLDRPALHRLLRVAGRRRRRTSSTRDYTTEELYKEGAKRGAIDPCFPSKIGIPHVHNLLYKHHEKKPLDVIFFPMIDALPTRSMVHAQAQPRLPDGDGHAGGGEGGLHQGGRPLRRDGHRATSTRSSTSTSRGCSSGRCSTTFGDVLGLSREENDRARGGGLRRPRRLPARPARAGARGPGPARGARTASASCCWAGRTTTTPGINHEILDEFQKLGYPVFTQDALPIDDDIL